MIGCDWSSDVCSSDLVFNKIPRDLELETLCTYSKEECVKVVCVCLFWCSRISSSRASHVPHFACIRFLTRVGMQHQIRPLEQDELICADFGCEQAILEELLHCMSVTSQQAATSLCTPQHPIFLSGTDSIHQYYLMCSGLLERPLADWFCNQG